MYCDSEVFVYSVFVFHLKMTCFISNCPVPDLGSKKCICMYVCMYVCKEFLTHSQQNVKDLALPCLSVYM
jgi:hypothetical protein